MKIIKRFERGEKMIGEDKLLMTIQITYLNEEEKNMLCEEIPAGRFGTCEEVARTVLALAESPAYLTAQIIGIDGGFL